MTHEKGLWVELVSTICKSSQCELLVKENQIDAVNSILTQIGTEPWWCFKSNQFSSNSNYQRTLYYI